MGWNLLVAFFSIFFSIAYGQGNEQYEVDIVVDSKTLNLRFDEGDNPRQLAYQFCERHSLLHAEEGNTGVNCVKSVETLIVSKMPGTLADLQVSNTKTIVIEPPKTVFPYKIDRLKLKSLLGNAEVKNEIIFSAYLYGHDANIVSSCNGNILGVIELERITRKRYYDLSQQCDKHSHHVAEKKAFAIQHLSDALKHLNHVTFSEENKKQYQHDCPSIVGNENMYDRIVIVDSQTRAFLIEAIKEVVSTGKDTSIIIVNHHDSHALLAYYDSPFYYERRSYEDDLINRNLTLILSFDGFGNDGTFMIYRTKCAQELVEEKELPSFLPLSKLELVKSVNISLGQSYMVSAAMLKHFWTYDQNGNKTIAPCRYNVNPACRLRLPGVMMAYSSLGRVRVEWLKGVRRLLTHGVVVEKWLPEVRRHGEDLYFDLNERGQRDFASTVQSVFETIVIEELEDAMHLVERDFHERNMEVAIEGIVLVGGCALNVKANTVVQNYFRVPVYVPSSPGDSGIAIGGAWFVTPPIQKNPLEFLGAKLFDQKKLSHYVEKYQGRKITPKDVSELLLDGKVGAIVRGRAEVGPRALLHRSLVALPDKLEVRDKMNRIKHREWYRPCAPILNEEDVGKVFENSNAKIPWHSPYMSFAPTLTEEIIRKFPAISHVDGTARPQTVNKSNNPWTWELLRLIGQKTGTSILINTSFNAHGRPIVNTIRQSIKLLLESEDLDFLVVEDYLFTKRSS